MANINDILNDARIKGCSDVHIGENTGITLRQDGKLIGFEQAFSCLLYTSPSPRDTR